MLPFPQRADLDPWVLFVVITALIVSTWMSRSVFATQNTRPAGLPALLAVGVLSAGASGILWGAAEPVLVPLAAFLALTIALARAGRRLSVPGSAWLSISFLGLVIGWAWSCLFVSELGLPVVAETLALLGLTLTLAMSFLAAVERIAREAVLTHQRWNQPTHAPRRRTHFYHPKVSVHLPCYAEPPEVVKETMNRLARLDYPDFEVLVCDNNTQDEALWRPLEEHARVLNRRAGKEVFRFFHVAPLAGAKAGALNFLLERMAPDAKIVAVVDADYYSTPDFLERLVPFFADPEIGYLQTPHNYREFRNSAYQSACFAEYMPNNKVDLPGVHEYGGAFTIGTMCLLRTAALKAAGGWAEWCLTEDSEVSVRLRAIGCRGIYLAETFGRGLIPDNFDDYKKQRFRWTAGPVQQLRRHWRLFLPAPYARPMPGWTKLLEVLRCIAPLQALVGVATGLLTLAGLVSAALLGRIEPVDVPNIAWLLLPLGTLTLLVRTWHRYRLTGISRLRDMVGGEVARAALSYVVLLAGVAGLSAKPLAWRRTPKFGSSGTAAGALSSALPETILGLAALAAAALYLQLAGGIGMEVALLGAGGLAFLGLRFLCAPVMALLPLWDRPVARSKRPVPIAASERLLPERSAA